MGKRAWGERWGAPEQWTEGWRSWHMVDLYSPTQRWGGWSGCMAWGTPMLVLSWAGSSGWVNHHGTIILGTFVVPWSCPSMPQRAPSSSSSFIVGVLIFVPLSSSMSPVLQCPLFRLSFSKILPLDIPRALHQSMTIPAYPVIIAIVVLVVIVVASSVSDGSFCAEIVANIESLNILHTLMVHRSHGQGDWHQSQCERC